MRLSTRLLSNAATTYLRLGTTFVIGLFTTWYILGAVGVSGFGLIALAFSSAGPSHALERSFRSGLVRELSAAIASGEPGSVRCTVTSAFRLCLQVTLPLGAFVLVFAGAAWAGLFNTPEGQPALGRALAILILAEGIHAAVRLLSAPYVQCLFADQQLGLDNLLMVVARLSYALSAVLVFGWLLSDAGLVTQLLGFGLSRCTLQLADVVLGVALAKRRFVGLRLDRLAYEEAEYRSVRSTVWHSSQVSLLLDINPQFLAVLINLFFGLTYNSIWQIAVQFSGYAWMFAEGLLRGIEPLTTRLQQSGRFQAVVSLMARSVRYQLAMILPAAIFLGLWAGPLLELWVGRRLATDPNLAASGFAASEALRLAATMAGILLAAHALRAGFLGVERILYGMGKVRSYAWFSKWATLIAISLASVLMALARSPVAAPVALALAQCLFSPWAVLRAARREMGISLGAMLRRSLPRPIVAGLLFFAMLVPIRLLVDRLTPFSLATLLLGSALLYGVLGLLLITESDERRRVAQLLDQGLRWVRRWLAPRAKS